MSFIPCITLANLTTPVTNIGGGVDPLNPTYSTITAETIRLSGQSGTGTAAFKSQQPYDPILDLTGTETGTYPTDQLGINNIIFSQDYFLGNKLLGTIGFDTLRGDRVDDKYDLRLRNAQGRFATHANVIVDGFKEIDASGSDIYVSSVTTTGIYLDAQVLTADADQLFLNGVPVATTANISSIADWSYYAQVSTLDGNNQNIKSINNIQAFSGNFQSLTTSVLTVNTVVSQSTINNYSTINTVDVIADLGNISTLTGSDLTFTTLNGQANFTSTITLGDTTTGLLSVNGAGVLLYNGSTITAGGGGSASNWSAYPATQIVNMNTQGLSNAGAITAASLAASGNVAALSNLVAGNNVYAGNAIEGLSILGSNSVGSLQDIGAGRDIIAQNNIRAVGTITANNTNNDTNTITGATTIYGGLNGTLSFTTNGGLNGFRATTGLTSIISAVGMSLAASAGISVAAGATTSIAGGDHISLDAGYIDCIGGSIIKVNSIQKQSGSLSIDSTTIVNSGTIYTNVLSAPSIIPSLAGQTSSIVGVDLIANSNSFVAKNMSTINLNVNTINGSAYPPAVAQSQFISSLSVSTINGQETTAYFTQPKIETTFFSSLGANLVVSNDVATDTLEVSTINGIPISNYLNVSTFNTASVSSLTASSITSYFGSISTLNISTLNSFPAYQILPNQPTYQIYVAKNGSDTLGTGSIMQPFLTIGKALTTATAYPDTNIVTILLTPGNYTETVNVTRNNTFINGLSVNSQEVSITGAVSFTTTTQTIGYIVGGITGLTITGSLTFSSTAAVPILYTALSGVINGISGTIPLTISQTSTTNSFSFTTQGMVISPVDTIGVSVNNTRVSFVQTLITGTTTLIQTLGVGSFTLFGSTLTNTNATATAPPIVKLANTVAVASGAMQINNSYISYTSPTVDTGLNKCCVQLSTTTTAAMNMSYNFLYCEGARVTNGSAGQYECVQNPGTGTITFNYGGNYSGASANHFPNASAKFVKTGYVATT